MADSMLTRLKSMLTASPSAGTAQSAPPPPELGGMAGQAQAALKNRAYQLHLAEMQAMGQMPLTPEQFANTH